ncbi:MAG: toll/interleukin-1 receptor domain-containing protein, partial [Candidatus Thiodiazotropha sp.]
MVSTNPARKTPSIFVSYRIADTLTIADRLAAELQRTFGAEAVFFDRRTIEPGDAWPSDIKTAVEESTVVLVLIGKKWLTEQNQYGRRRLDLPEDWVRREIEAALSSAGVVIPVLVDGASPPLAESLVDVPSIAELSSHQAAALRTADWDADFNALVEKLVARGLQVITAEAGKRPIIPGRIASRGQTPFVGRDAELEDLTERLPAIGEAGVVVVRGKPGVGKSEVAREYARRHQDRYGNGAFFIAMEQGKIPVGLATYGSRNLGLAPSGLNIEEQCAFVLRNLQAPTLFIFDNVANPDDVLPWLPADDETTHVLITTTWEEWYRWPQVEVGPLDDRQALEVVQALGGSQVAELYGGELVSKAAGLPIQLCPATRSVAKALRRHSDVQVNITDEAETSFTGVWHRLEPEGRLVLAAATLFNPDRIRTDLLRSHLAEAAGCSAATIDVAINACMDLSLLEPGESELRMHRLFREYVRSAEGADGKQLTRFRDIHVAAFIATARMVESNPADSALISDFVCYPLAHDQWSLTDHPLGLSGSDNQSIGDGLIEIGLFEEAKPWYERAVTEKEQGDVHGRVDHASLGSSLHQVGCGLSSTGDYAGAKPWYERAVSEAEQGDVHGRVDHERLGRSLDLVGYCLSSTGDYAGAKPWYERAVTEKEQGDVHGR